MILSIKSINRKILLTLFIVMGLQACAINSVHSMNEINERELSYCNINPELIVGVEDGAIEQELEIKYCSYVPTDGEVMVIIVKVGSQKHIYWDVSPIGAKIYAEYLFRKKGDILLTVYGFDAPNKDGNYFDYNLYRIGHSGVWRSGDASDRIRIRELLKSEPILE